MQHSALLLIILLVTIPDPCFAQKATGVRGTIDCLANSKRVSRLPITKPGLYENNLVANNWAGGNRVKIIADKVTVRNCEIRNASENGIGVFGKDLTINNLGIGKGIARKHHQLGRGPYPGFESLGE
jgi:hypothetical protein